MKIAFGKLLSQPVKCEIISLVRWYPCKGWILCDFVALCCLLEGVGRPLLWILTAIFFLWNSNKSLWSLKDFWKFFFSVTLFSSFLLHKFGHTFKKLNLNLQIEGQKNKSLPYFLKKLNGMVDIWDSNSPFWL